MAKSVTHACVVRNYSMQIKFDGKIFSWVQLTHENITQRINFTTNYLERIFPKLRYIVD